MVYEIFHEEAGAWLKGRSDYEFRLILTDPPPFSMLYPEFLRVARNVVFATGQEMLSKDSPHPGAKHVEPYVELIKALRKTVDFDTIVDPYMGTAAIGVAALRCGLNYIGIERKYDWVKIAESRLAAEMQS